VEERLDSVVSSVFDRAGLPNKGEIDGLSQRVEELTKMVERLKQSKG
jgi:polyhydroxyalkanoate synthesis regulator phasin